MKSTMCAKQKAGDKFASIDNKTPREKNEFVFQGKNPERKLKWSWNSPFSSCIMKAIGELSTKNAYAVTVNIYVL